jgi:hypothetical protein
MRRFLQHPQQTRREKIVLQSAPEEGAHICAPDSSNKANPADAFGRAAMLGGNEAIDVAGQQIM